MRGHPFHNPQINTEVHLVSCESYHSIREGTKICPCSMCFHNCFRHPAACKISFISAMGNLLCPRLEWKQVLLWFNFLVFSGWAAQAASNSPLPDGLSIVYTWPSLADIVWMIKYRLQRFQRGKGSFTKAANMENVLHADVLDHRLKIPYLITLPHHVKWSRHYQIKNMAPVQRD